MTEIDVVDEAIIDADPAVVAQAIADEMAGKTHWWLPRWEGKQRGEIPPNQVGGIIDIAVRRPPMRYRARWTAKTVESAGNTLRQENVAGAFRGEGLWAFEPDGGKTRLRFHWRVRPSGWLIRFAANFIDIGKVHSEVMRAGFNGLNQYLKQTDAARAHTPA